MSSSREFDVVVHGATGFTGKLVAEHVFARYGTGKDVRWAISGRITSELEAVRRELGAGDLPVIVADAVDPSSLETLTDRTAVVISTMGPYQLYGEPAWMAQMIIQQQKTAKASGAPIARLTANAGLVFAIED